MEEEADELKEKSLILCGYEHIAEGLRKDRESDGEEEESEEGQYRQKDGGNRSPLAVSRETGRPLTETIQMTPAEREIWRREFRANPPLHIMIASYLGYYEEKSEEDDEAARIESEEESMRSELAAEMEEHLASR